MALAFSRVSGQHPLPCNLMHVWLFGSVTRHPPPSKSSSSMVGWLSRPGAVYIGQTRPGHRRSWRERFSFMSRLTIHCALLLASSLPYSLLCFVLGLNCAHEFLDYLPSCTVLQYCMNYIIWLEFAAGLHLELTSEPPPPIHHKNVCSASYPILCKYNPNYTNKYVTQK